MERLFITNIEITQLWGMYDLGWDLTPDVNILSGVNGSGKSTVLRCLSSMFSNGMCAGHPELMKRIDVRFSDGSAVSTETPFDPERYHIEVISTSDNVLQQSEAIAKLSDGHVATSLDWVLYKLQTRYLSYQLEVGKRVIAALKQGNAADIDRMTAPKSLYFDIIDSLFESTGKEVDRENDTLRFRLRRTGRTIEPYQLSSGEKQILIILTTVLVHNGNDLIMIMDEPEISLHFDWQRRLIEDLRALNPNLQLILSTHSPAVVMNGWTDRVSEIGDLIRNGQD